MPTYSLDNVALNGGHAALCPLAGNPPMQYDPRDLKPRERYKVLTSFVLPRPIAWVTTLGPTGVVNAAPFSFLQRVLRGPTALHVRLQLGPDGLVKDTLAISSVPASSWST